MWRNDLKMITRNLLRHKGYSFINLLGLAVGMTCCILIMLYVQDERSYDRYHKDADRIYRLVMSLSTQDRGRIRTARTPPAWAPVLARAFPEIESYVRIKAPMVSWMVGYAPENKRFHEAGFYFADAAVFDVFNFRLLRGDAATALEEPNTVVLTESTARKYFGAADPMGKTMRLDNAFDLKVTGILEDIPPNTHFHFDFLGSFETLNANAIYGGLNYGKYMQNFSPDLYTYLRLREGASPASFERKMPAFIDRHYKDALARRGAKIRTRLQAVPRIHLHSHLDGELQANGEAAYLYIFSAIAFFILLIACINFMNLATARSAGRAREVGIRKVLGACRSRMIARFMGESLLLSALALLLAVGAVYALLPAFNALSGKALRFSFNGTAVVPGLAGITLLTGLLAGSYPALFLSAFQPAAALKGTVRAGAGQAALRKTLVVIQFAVSVIFIIGAGVVADQMRYVRNKNPGFDKAHLIVMPLGDPKQRVLYDTYKERISRNPAVLGVTASDAVPGGLIDTIAFQPEGAPGNETALIDNLWIDHDFIDTFGIELVAGRNFSTAFPTDTLSAFILNESAVAWLGWTGAPLGKKIKVGNNFKDGRVIGVVKDFHLKSLQNKIEPLMLQITPTRDLLHYFAIRISAGHIPATLDFLERQWREVYPNDPFTFSFLSEDFDNLYRTERLRGRVFRVFSALSVFIACLGLLGLASFTAEQRTREIGIRKVLGASVPGIVALLTREFVTLVLIADLIAWPVAYFVMNHWLNSFAYRVVLSPWGFLRAGVLAVAITLLTVSCQAVKAAWTRPAEALQYE